MGLEPTHHSILVFDIERYGSRPDPIQWRLRREMYSCIEDAMRAAGLPADGCFLEDRGDGVLMLIPSTVEYSKYKLVDTFLPKLEAALRGYAKVSNEAGRMRMRLAMHSGELGRDDRGWIGAAVNTACRLCDVQTLRDALASVPEAHVALIVSDEWFQAVIRHEHGAIDASTYTQVPVDSKELHVKAWIHVPGTRERPVVAAPEPAATQPPAQNHFSGNFAGPVFGQAGDVTINQAPPAPDHWALGMQALHNRAYPAAQRHLRERLAEPAAPPEAHYYLAIALLGGRAPRYMPSTVEIRDHLVAADPLPQARLLRLLVDEDHERLWIRGRGPGYELLAGLLGRISSEDAHLIVQHVPAPECRTWQALTRKATDPSERTGAP
ncbi:hypothetical protein [Longispora albida]|uniref:hypothetical protein n=1 Tax=Longispora albida TaxID=203523 RepID=UPI00036A256E|nr:hypothetical protein [Longispora albida]